MGSLAEKFFHLICVKNYSIREDYDEDYFQRGFDDAKKFFSRFDNKIDFRGKKILDVGCGYGSACIYLALNGAKKVVGVDTDKCRIDFARTKLANDYQKLSSIVEFRLADELGNEEFDIVISKDSFEHYTVPESLIMTMKQCLNQEGIMVIGFGPLWKSPYGGHIGFMTKFPWAHLLFPESVIMNERKRFRPNENAETFEQILGGLNKMTLKRFLQIVENSQLEFVYFKTNDSKDKLARIFTMFSHFPFCKEYFTFNFYCILPIRIQKN